MLKNLFRYACLALILCCGAGFATVARADVKIKARNTSGGQVSEQTTYIKGKRQRTELNEATVTITQCDLRRNLQLGVPTKTYVVTPFDQNAADTASAKTSTTTTTRTPSQRGGIITSTFTATDTGERKKMFGYTARRIKTTIITESSPEACQTTRSRMETDGWYIDAAFALDCDAYRGTSYTNPADAGGCRDEFRAKYVGVAKLGYPVLVKTTLFDEQGNESFTFTQEVLEIANAVLDNALFEAPADYRQVKDMSELYSAAAIKSAARDDADSNDAMSGGGASSAGSAAGAKRAGVVRVGVALTKTVAAADYVDASALADAVRRVLVSNLNGSTIEVVTLEARQTQAVEAEAKQRECDFVLYSNVSHKKGGGGGFGGFLKKSAAIAGGVVAPSEGGGGTGVAGTLKARDELTLEYKLQRGADAVAANTIKAKAKADGDDIITQLATQAATAVRAAAASK
ncbi:MAG TPA: hypothetical protein VGW12_00710 [Pyrinomonadaceae bacterium]|nr:hypothetical protein [Pyrinomonadaceae bacterium]